MIEVYVSSCNSATVFIASDLSYSVFYMYCMCTLITLLPYLNTVFMTAFFVLELKNFKLAKD